MEHEDEAAANEPDAIPSEGGSGAGESALGAAASKRLRSILESLLFAVSEPVSPGRLLQVLPGYERREIGRALQELAEEYQREERGFRLQQVAGGWQFRTARANADFVKALLQQRPQRLTRAALETVAVVAYRQPVTRAEIEAIRGVEVDAVLTTLLERRLVKVLGRKDVVGRPLLYGTTPEFLETFGLKDLASLPTLDELGESAEALERAASVVAEAERQAAEDAAASGAMATEGHASEAPADAPGETTRDGDSEEPPPRD